MTLPIFIAGAFCGVGCAALYGRQNGAEMAEGTAAAVAECRDACSDHRALALTNNDNGAALIGAYDSLARDFNDLAARCVFATPAVDNLRVARVGSRP